MERHLAAILVADMVGSRKDRLGSPTSSSADQRPPQSASHLPHHPSATATAKGPSYVSSMNCRRRQPSTDALLMLSGRLEITAQQFSLSEYQSIRNKSRGTKLLADEVRQEIDKRISI